MYNSFEKLPESARVWVYQADRTFSAGEEEIISEALTAFCSQWSAHGDPLQTSFKIQFKRFIVLSVDESTAGASGCSIDGSVRVLKELGNQLKLDFFDRTKITFVIDGAIQGFSLGQLRSLFDSGQLTSSTTTFNNLVATKGEFEMNWETSVKKSWLVKYLPNEALLV